MEISIQIWPATCATPFPLKSFNNIRILLKGKRVAQVAGYFLWKFIHLSSKSATCCENRASRASHTENCIFQTTYHTRWAGLVDIDMLKVSLKLPFGRSELVHTLACVLLLCLRCVVVTYVWHVALLPTTSSYTVTRPCNRDKGFWQDNPRQKTIHTWSHSSSRVALLVRHVSWHRSGNVMGLWPLQVEWEMLALSLTRQCLMETSAREKNVEEAALHSNVKAHVA